MHLSLGRSLLLVLLAVMPPLLASGGSAEEAVTDPYLGQADAIAAGRDTYRSKCYICHHSAGGRGPNVFATKLTDEQFLKTVTRGRQGTQMPAFSQRLSADDIWKLLAFVRSTDHY